MILSHLKNDFLKRESKNNLRFSKKCLLVRSVNFGTELTRTVQHCSAQNSTTQHRTSEHRKYQNGKYQKRMQQIRTEWSRMEENRTELRMMEQNRTKWHSTAHQNRAQAALQCRAEHG